MNRKYIDQKKSELKSMMVRRTPEEARDKATPLAREAGGRDETPAEAPFAGNEVRRFLRMVYDSQVVSGGEVGGGKFCNDYLASLNEINQKVGTLNSESLLGDLLKIAKEFGCEIDGELWRKTVKELKIEESKPARFQIGEPKPGEPKEFSIPINPEVEGMKAVRAIAPQLVEEHKSEV